MDKWYLELDALQDEMSPVPPEDEQPFTLRYSRGFVLLCLIMGVLSLGMGILFLVLATDHSMMIIVCFCFLASAFLLGLLPYSGSWRCEVNSEYLTVRWLFHQKVIPWCSVRSAKWLIKSTRMDVIYTLVLFDERKKLLDLDSSVDGLHRLKNMVRSKQIPLCRKSHSFRDVHHPEV